MKFLFVAFVAFVCQVSAIPLIASGSNQIISPGNSVAYNLADTLNLLTVSSLLSGALPYQSVKIPVIPPCAGNLAVTAPAYAIAPSCGCGCGCGSANYASYYY